MTSQLPTGELPPLRTGPALVAAAVFAAPLSAALQLAVDSGDLSATAATLAATGLAASGLIAVVGLLLARSRWSRRYSGAVVLAAAGLAAVVPWSAASWVTLLAAAAATAGLAGPTLDGWLRKRPAALGPSAEAAVLMLVGTAAPFVAGVGAWSAGDPGDVVYGAAVPALAWAFGQRWVWGFWGLRLAPVPLAGFAALGNPLAGALAVVLHGATVVVMAWRKRVRIDVKPLLDTLPGPRIATPKDDT